MGLADPEHRLVLTRTDADLSVLSRVIGDLDGYPSHLKLNETIDAEGLRRATAEDRAVSPAYELQVMRLGGVAVDLRTKEEMLLPKDDWRPVLSIRVAQADQPSVSQ